jgi:putative oxidoreductase
MFEHALRQLPKELPMIDPISHSDALALAGGLLVARLAFGLAFAAHGSQKLFGWFGGYGLDGTGGYFESLGYRPGRFFALAAGASELTAGILTATGLLGPVGPALMLMVMIVAMATVHAGNGFFAGSNGIEVPYLYAAVGVTLALAGPGALSLDALLGFDRLAGTAVATTALALAVVAALVDLALRRHEAAHAAGSR